MMQNYNNAFPTVVKDAIDSRFDTENNFVFFYTNDINNDGWTRGWVGVIAKNGQDAPYFYGEINNNRYQWSAYSLFNTIITCYKVNANRTTGQLGVTALGNNQAVFNNMISNVYSSNYDYISNFQIMTNNTGTAQVVLFYDDGVTIPDGDTARDDMEKPDIDNYIPSWTNRPTFDGSTVENAISSIWDITIWTAENTRDTIMGVGKFIGDTLRWTSQKIIDSIRGKIDELKTGIVNAINSVSAFVQDIKGLVTSIGTAIDYIKQPLDTSSVQATITNSTAFGDVSTITGAFADFKAVFDNTTEPNEYKIPLHLENVAILGQTQTQYIDLSIIANQRPLIRAFCWVVTTFSIFVTVADALPNYLKGGDE